MTTDKKVDLETFLNDPKHASDREFLDGYLDNWAERKIEQAKTQQGPTGESGLSDFLGALMGITKGN